jgi:hypothetical protein
MRVCVAGWIPVCVCVWLWLCVLLDMHCFALSPLLSALLSPQELATSMSVSAANLLDTFERYEAAAEAGVCAFGKTTFPAHFLPRVDQKLCTLSQCFLELFVCVLTPETIQSITGFSVSVVYSEDMCAPASL